MGVDDTDLLPLEEAASVRRGRQFQIKVRKNREARLAALATVRERPDGQWHARVGGMVHGRTVVQASRKALEAEIEEHYNAALMEAVRRINRS